MNRGTTLRSSVVSVFLELKTGDGATKPVTLIVETLLRSPKPERS